MKDPDNGWQRRRSIWGSTGAAPGAHEKHGHGVGLTRAATTIDGVPYHQMVYAQCVCGNSRPADHDFCDRCEQLHALGYKMRLRPS